MLTTYANNKAANNQVNRTGDQRNWKQSYQQAMAQKEPISVVLFDWDRTLAHVLGNASSSERLTALFRSEGIPISQTNLESAIEAYWKDIRAGALPTMPTPPQTRQDIIQYYRHLLARVGYTDISWEEADRLYSAYAYLPTHLYDDCLPTLRVLQERGCSLGIISNHATAARPVIQRYVGEFIAPEHIIISQEVGVHKPAKTIFRHAVTRFNVAPQNCIFVGDNLEVDAVGAVEQGGFSIGLWLDRYGSETGADLPENVVRIRSLDEVLRYV